MFAGLDQSLVATGFPFVANLGGVATADGLPSRPAVVSAS
jgi:hypothetical protein